MGRQPHRQIPFMCHQITDAQCLHTRPIQTDNPLHQSQQKLVTQTEEAWGQRLGVNLVVVMVPDWLSNLITLPLTKCEIQPVVTGQSGYKKVSWLSLDCLTTSPSTHLNLMPCDWSLLRIATLSWLRGLYVTLIPGAMLSGALPLIGCPKANWS